MYEIFSQYLPLWIFILLMVSTPGPANLLLVSSGAQNGFMKTIPFISGLVLGKLFLNVLFSLGLGIIVRDYSIILKIFAYVSVIYIIWLSLRGWNAHKKELSDRSILGYKEGLLVHPLSPKTWAMCLIAYSKFTENFTSIFEIYFLVPISFFILQIFFHNLWCFVGHSIDKTIGLNSYLNRILIFITTGTVIWALFLVN